jgi:phage protein D
MKSLVTLGAVRPIALQVLVNGALLPGAVSADVTQNSHYQPDTWRAEFALYAPGAPSLEWWGGDALKGALFDVQASIDGGQGWTSLIIGEADEIEIDPVWGSVRAKGKDLTQRLVAAKTQEAFANQTASEIATTLAGRHGLTAQVTATTTLVKRFYAVDHDQITHDQFSRVRTEWDLLTELARDEGFDVFVSGTKLYFQPGVTLPGSPYTVRFDPASRALGATRLVLRRSLTLAKDVQVVVRSWRSREGRSFQRGSPSGSTTGQPKDGVTRYVYTRPNLTEDQAQKLADQYREQITRHERTGTIECPVELAVSPRDVIQLEGVGTGWEAQPYYVGEVTRHIGQDGTEQTIAIKNHGPQTDEAAP